jgi:hypothetical protein
LSIVSHHLFVKTKVNLALVITFSRDGLLSLDLITEDLFACIITTNNKNFSVCKHDRLHRIFSTEGLHQDQVDSFVEKSRQRLSDERNVKFCVVLAVKTPVQNLAS